MPPIVLTIEIARPPDEVFSYVTDPSRFAEWQEDAEREAVRPAWARGSPQLAGSVAPSGRRRRR